MSKRKSRRSQQAKPLDAPQGGRFTRITLAAILVLGAALRFFYLAQLQSDPLPEAISGMEAFDQYRFMESAKEFLAGNWLGSSVPSYSLAYSYLIAILYKFFPHHTNTLFVFQILCGLGAIYLFYRTASLLFNKKIVGLIAAFMAACYAPFVFQDCDMERGALIATLNLLGFYLLLRAARKYRMRYFLFGGLAVGASLALRVNVLPVFIMVYLLVAVKKPNARKAAAAALFLTGILLAVSPLAIRNKVVGNTFSIEYQGLKTFWLGNAPDSPGVGFYPLSSSESLNEESQGNVLKAISILILEIKEHPRAYLSLYGRKIKMFLGGYEVPSNLSYDLFKENHSALKIAFLDFGIISPLALVGIFLARRKYPSLGLLYLFLAVISVSNILFHILGRYRIPAVPFFIILASYAVFRCAGMLRQKRFLEGGLAVLSVILLSFWTRPDDAIIRYTLGSRVRPIDYYNLAIAYSAKATQPSLPKDRKDGLLKQAIVYVGKAIETDPNDKEAYNDLGIYQFMLGNSSEAIAALEKAIRINPRFFLAYFNLGLIYNDLGNKEKAIPLFKEAASTDPNDPTYSKAYYELGLIYRSLGKEQEAAACLQKAKVSNAKRNI